MGKAHWLFGRNILEEALAIRAPIVRIRAEHEGAQKFVEEVLRRFKVRIPIERGMPRELKEFPHQGVAFETSFSFYHDEFTPSERESRILLCNHLEDPQNLGSLARAASAFGFSWIIHESRRSVHLTPSAVKASAGLAFRVKFYECANLTSFIPSLKKRGFTIYSLDLVEESMSLYEAPREEKMALVIGAEGSGLQKSVREASDFVVRIPMVGHTESLNAAQSGTVAMSWFFQGNGGKS